MHPKLTPLHVLLTALLFVHGSLVEARTLRKQPAPAAHLQGRLACLNAELAAVTEVAHAQAVACVPGPPREVIFPIPRVYGIFHGRSRL